jgi:hypothetical protein
MANEAEFVIEDRFDRLVEALLEDPDVAPPAAGKRRFGSNAVTVHGQIFAMLVRGQLVLKLPARRVSELVEAGEGVQFDANKGRPMKEWLVVATDSSLDWLTLALEARQFVGRRSRKG